MGYPFGPMVRLLILTAQRRAEISGLRRDWLLPDQKAFEVPASYYKTDRPQVVPLSAPALAIVEGLPKWNSGDFLLSTTAGKVPVSRASFASAPTRWRGSSARSRTGSRRGPRRGWRDERGPNLR
jgi:integrase